MGSPERMAARVASGYRFAPVDGMCIDPVPAWTLPSDALGCVEGVAFSRCGALFALAHAVDERRLPEAAETITTLGRAAGPPWRRAHKDAARAAMTLLAPA